MRASVGTLQREIQQRVPFRTPAHEVLIGLLYTTDLARRAVSQIVERRGITHQQYNVLRILRGSREEGVPTLEIARRMIEKTPGITRLLDRLERQDRVRRQRCPSDRRQVLCWITDLGLTLLDDLEPEIQAIEDRPGRALTDDQLASLIHLLDAVRADFRELDGTTNQPGDSK